MEAILTVFGVDWRLLTAQVVNFLILLYILKRFLYVPLLAMIEKRQGLIIEGVKNAEEAGKLKMSAEEEKNTLLKEARKEGDAFIAEAKETATKVKERILAESETEKQALLAAAEKEKEALLLAAKKQAEVDAVKVSILMAEKVLREGRVI